MRNMSGSLISASPLCMKNARLTPPLSKQRRSPEPLITWRPNSSRAGRKLRATFTRSASLPVAAQAVILKALAYAKQDRYACAKDFGDALAQALTAEAVESPSSRLELAHVLFTDLVGYSTLPINEQERLLQQLQKIVSGTEEFIRAQAARQLLRLPTGDGMALVFFGDPVAPAQCAVEIAGALREQPDIKL